MTRHIPRIGLGLLMAMLAFVLAASADPALAGPGQRVAVFDFELLDMSLEGEIRGLDPAEQARLGLISTQLRTWLAANGRYELADISAVAAEAKAANLHACGCVQGLAGRIDAELAVTGLVHKISNLILNITIYVLDVRTNTTLALMNVDIRSNTDQSWTRGLNWLIKHRLSGVLAAPVEGEP